MNLLIVSYMLPPMLYPQAIQIGRLLANIHMPIVAASASTKNDQKNADPVFDALLVHRIQIPGLRLRQGVAHSIALRLLPLYCKTPDAFVSWVPKAESAILAYLEGSSWRPDVILTFGAPMSDHLVGLRLKSKLNIPWIAHFSDPWVDNPFSHHHFVSKIINHRLEKKVVERADVVVFTSSETVDLVMKKYPSSWREKTEVLPHSFDPARYYGHAPPKAGPIVVRYLGNFYGRRSPYPLFKALARLLRDNPDVLEDVRFELVGGISRHMLWNRAYRSLPAGLVSILGSVSYSESLDLMDSADLLLVIDAPAAVSVFLPSKLVDYLGSGVPIFGIAPLGTSARLIRQLGGYCADPMDVAGISNQLISALKEAKMRRQAIHSVPWGNTEVRKNYDVHRVAACFKTIISSLES